MPRLINASSAHSWELCIRRAWYDYNPPDGFEAVEDRFESLRQTLGDEHERRVCAQFEQVVLAESIDHTRELMEMGVAVIYQPYLEDSERGIQGRPDFLIRSAAGYQAADAKLAQSLKDKKAIQAQLAIYRSLLGNEVPALVYLGDGETETIGPEADKVMNRFLDEIRAALDSEKPPRVDFANSRCRECPYDSVCRPRFFAEDNLTLTYGVQSRSADALRAHGIGTRGALALSDATTIPDLPYLKGEKRQRAVLQAKSQLNGEVHILSRPELPSGTWVHFDVESFPLGEKLDYVYLWGFLVPPYTAESFEYVWIDGEDEDGEGWGRFLELLEDFRKRFPDLVLAHFSHYELQRIRDYAERFQAHDHPTVAWLLGESSPLFDLKKVVDAHFVLPLLDYGLKSICKHKDLVNFQWELQESGSQWSVVRYYDFLAAPTQSEQESIKGEILGYNRDDVRASRALEEWVRRRGAE